MEWKQRVSGAYNETRIIRSNVDPKVSYPSRMKIDVETIEFGSGTQQRLSSVHDGEDPRQFAMVADIHRRELKICFALDAPKKPARDGNTARRRREFKIAIEFRQLTELIVQDVNPDAPEDNTTWLSIPLKNPPAYFQRDDEVQKRSFDAEKLTMVRHDQWTRTTYIFDDQDITQDFTIGLLVHWDDPTFINIGRCTTIRLRIDRATAPLDTLLRALHDLNIETLDHSPIPKPIGTLCLLPPENRAVRNVASYDQNVIVTDDIHGLSLLGDHTPTVPPLNYPVQYQLEVCISKGILNEFLLSREFLARLRALDPIRAQHMLEYLADKGKPIDDPMSIHDDEQAQHYYPKVNVPHYCAIIRKALITPTTIYYSSPSMEASNRILRQFSHLQDRFLRVQFIDELHLGRLKSMNTVDQDHYLFRRVFHTLVNGIRVGDRHFKFLAFGNSQIRECGAYFFSETGDTTCKSIRSWMGDFDHIRVVAKCAARIGQCFSTTRQIQGFRTPKVTRIDDINRNGYCFTDGIGKMSSFLAQVISQEMGIDSKVTPSAFQFRMGGCKGILAVWPDVGMTEVQIRESQEKFKARFNGLEIIRVSRFSVASLNRQMITILASLGVPREAFLKLADIQLLNYKQAMVDQATASTLLSTHVDENQTSLAMKDLINWGFMDNEIQEPFVMTILQLWRTWSMKLLKEKARVIVEKGAFVLGCVDETGTLRGHSTKSERSRGKMNVDELPQIFLQVPEVVGKPGYRVIEGLCLVGRNPSLHPGDIRLVQAVDCEALHHMRDVVVFPSIGDRDVPGMLSGGDLDGDDFFVIWEPTLFPPRWNYPPMDYRAPPPTALTRDVNHHDLAQFFVKYMRNDRLPFIAISHLAIADDHIDGARSRKCLELASLHSKAVDFVKTGDPAILSRTLQPQRWPHFMERRTNSYKSGSALGLIYDKVGEVSFSPIYENKFDQRILSKYELEEDMLNKVREIKARYDVAVRRLMAQREIETEFEIWTGFVLSRPRVGSGYKLSEDIGREASIIKQQFREQVYEVAGGSHIEVVGPWVAAMYKVTEEEVNAKRAEKEAQAQERERNPQHQQDAPDVMPLISFPWIFHTQLGYIATGEWARDVYVDTDTTADNLYVRDWGAEKTHEEGLGPIIVDHKPVTVRTVFTPPMEEEETASQDGESDSEGDIYERFDEIMGLQDNI
ncbi:RNA dependent RNA polymerase [Plectosphaerella plurivora]|uniref:RNA-dependent RNA polymerase n=1 Tax=Plectosphaerella plurivora TaxID=936078 RepID=A0A9P9AFG7_9PEZI|nr:RNA dependent RNA polymerase [Plectosphaerella plurivora]